MIVEGNGFTFALENKLVKKLDLMIQRITKPKPKLDCWLAIHGNEGEGKSNTSVLIAYYIKLKTKRQPYLFFRLEGLINHAKNSEGNIYIWDEPSLDSLSTDQLKKIGRDLLRLVMTIRKKRHFFIVNFTKFWKFPEYVVVDRCLGMVHMYSKDEIQFGRFVYIKKSNLENLWNDYAKLKKRNYRKYKSFGGGFPERMTDYFDKMDFTVENIPHATLKDYEKQKDIAIGSIGGTEEGMSKKELLLYRRLNGLKYRITLVKGYPREKLAKEMGINSSRLREWSKIPVSDTDLQGKVGFELRTAPHINISMEGMEGNENVVPNYEEVVPKDDL